MEIGKSILFLPLALLGTLGCATLGHEGANRARPERPVGGERSAAGPAEAERALIAEPQAVRETTLEALPAEAPAEEPRAQRPVHSPSTRVPAAEGAARARRPHAPQVDSLVELLGKDIDKALGQPPDRRRIEFSSAVTRNPKVRYFLRHYSRNGRAQLRKLLARSGRYWPMIAKILNEEGLPEELGYLALIESGFVPHRASPRGAVGLWQFVPATARHYGLKIDRWVDERRDPVKATRAAAAYLKDLHDYFGRWYLVTAAYNAGPGTVDRALQSSGTSDFWTLSGNARLSNETRDFVPKFVAVAMIAADPAKYGIRDIEYEPPLEYREVEIDEPMSLATLAAMAETTVAELRELNPSLLHDLTPPDPSGFRIKIPTGSAAAFARAYRRHQETRPAGGRVVIHEVRRGETLFSIARRYGQEVRALMQLNGLASARLRVGQRLKVIVERMGGRLR
ncbi:MAG TPA: transglycosylase SLT domain-containing protein [candidate division Zixibacteria bacterium]|nr:transglycosylase SLT domain-containing protein [candidate division Zixibacteria bacterium]